MSLLLPVRTDISNSSVIHFGYFCNFITVDLFSSLYF
jgi:hypothetical protein